MARGLIRKPSFNKIVGAFRSQWKRSLLRLFLPGYGKKGMGWWRNPKKAWYNWWYHRTSVSLPRLLGYKPSRGACICALLVAGLFSVFAAPVDAVSTASKAHGIKRARKARTSSSGSSTGSKGSRGASSSSSTRTSSGGSYSSGTSYGSGTRSTRDTSASSTTRNTTTSHTSTSRGTSTSTTRSTSSSYSQRKTGESKPKTAPKTTPTYYPAVEVKREEEKKEPIRVEPIHLFEPVQPKPIIQPEPPKEPDENTPKSTPKNEGDQYIRKRMIIAGSSYCDAATLALLQVGTYFEVELELDNPYDKEAVKLVYQGEKIGYIAKKDKIAFVTCLKLRRNIYGVITAIKEENGRTQYEYETWFDNKR